MSPSSPILVAKTLMQRDAVLDSIPRNFFQGCGGLSELAAPRDQIPPDLAFAEVDEQYTALRRAEPPKGHTQLAALGEKYVSTKSCLTCASAVRIYLGVNFTSICW